MLCHSHAPSQQASKQTAFTTVACCFTYSAMDATPSPQAYNISDDSAKGGIGILGDARSFRFGTGSRDVTAKVTRTTAPGPGAYITDPVS
eukprot:jgi/Chrzof1/10850/Cz05g14140.t1